MVVSFCEILKPFMICPIDKPNPKGSCICANTWCVFATGAQGFSSLKVKSMSSIVIALIGPIGPLLGLKNGTLRESAEMPAESQEISSPDGCSADTPFATTAEDSPLR